MSYSSSNISFFDFIAFLLHELGEDITTRYAGLASRTLLPDIKYTEEADNYIQNIKSFYEDMYKCSPGDQLLKYIIQGGIPPHIYDAYLQNIRFRANKDAVYYLVKNISANLLNQNILLSASQEAEKMEQFKHKADSCKKNGFAQLNTDQSVKETGYILLPDLGTFGDVNKINNTTTTYEKIYLKGLIVVTPQDLKTRNGQSFVVRNIVPPEHYHLQDYPQDGKLVIAVSPIHKEWLLKDIPVVNVDETTDTKEYRFECDGVTNEDLIVKRVKAAYKTACQYEARILLFPEMYGTDRLSNEASKILEFSSDNHVPLVVMPSWWHSNLNTASVLDDSLLPLFFQAKHSPFVYDDKRKKDRYPMPSLEALINTENVIYLYHIPRIGRLCVCICKDFLMDSYRRMLSESLEASFILIPAFSPKIDQFISCMGELRHAGTYGVLVNCCAAFYSTVNPEKQPQDHVVGAVSLTRSSTVSDLASNCLLLSECSGNCGGEDKSCIFIIEITEDGFISVKHIHDNDT